MSYRKGNGCQAEALEAFLGKLHVGLDKPARLKAMGIRLTIYLLKNAN
jgi:hypothetical protein